MRNIENKLFSFANFYIFVILLNISKFFDNVTILKYNLIIGPNC